jgi:hypothetical protein
VEVPSRIVQLICVEKVLDQDCSNVGPSSSQPQPLDNVLSKRYRRSSRSTSTFKPEKVVQGHGEVGQEGGGVGVG